MTKENVFQIGIKPNTKGKKGIFKNRSLTDKTLKEKVPLSSNIGLSSKTKFLSMILVGAMLLLSPVFSKSGELHARNRGEGRVLEKIEREITEEMAGKYIDLFINFLNEGKVEEINLREKALTIHDGNWLEEKMDKIYINNKKDILYIRVEKIDNDKEGIVETKVDLKAFINILLSKLFALEKQYNEAVEKNDIDTALEIFEEGKRIIIAYDILLDIIEEDTTTVSKN